MKAYKGFKKDMTCRGFQFEEGKTYETENAVLCKSGFHACKDPLDCLCYYAPAESVYHEVELEDVSDERKGDDSKVCAKKITVGARLSLSQIVQAAFDFRFSRAKIAKGGHSTGYHGAASATGEWGAASATGVEGVAVALGVEGKVQGSVGCWIVAAEWELDKDFNYRRKDVKCVFVDGEKIKADTWYQLKDGEFTEA